MDSRRRHMCIVPLVVIAVRRVRNPRRLQVNRRLRANSLPPQ